MSGEVPQDDKDCLIYAVRVYDYYLYIGKTDDDVINRLNSHLGGGYHGDFSPSILGKIIDANMPRSLDWKVDLYSSDDVMKLVDDTMPGVRLDLMPAFYVKWIEPHLIRTHRPYCNTHYKIVKSDPLPAGILDYTVTTSWC